jgi:hypothetical protein
MVGLPRSADHRLNRRLYIGGTGFPAGHRSTFSFVEFKNFRHPKHLLHAVAWKVRRRAGTCCRLKNGPTPAPLLRDGQRPFTPIRYRGLVAIRIVLSIDNATCLRSLITSMRCLTRPHPGLLDKRFSRIVMRLCSRSPERTGSTNLTCQSKPPKKAHVRSGWFTISWDIRYIRVIV